MTEREEKPRCTENPKLSCSTPWRTQMHNLVAYNQLAEWKHLEEQTPGSPTKESEYYSCIIENSGDRQAERQCSKLLE